MPGKSKTPDKRTYQRDEPVSLRPLNLVTALGALLKVRPSPPESPAKSVSRPPKSRKPAEKADKR